MRRLPELVYVLVVFPVLVLSGNRLNRHGKAPHAMTCGAIPIQLSVIAVPVQASDNRSALLATAQHDGHATGGGEQADCG